MPPPVRLTGLHHVTLVTRDMDETLRFLTEVVGLGFVLDDINQDAPGQKHHFFGDEKGIPGTLVTFFEIPDLDDNRLGAGGMHHIALGVEEEDNLMGPDRGPRRETNRPLGRRRPGKMEGPLFQGARGSAL